MEGQDKEPSPGQPGGNTACETEKIGHFWRTSHFTSPAAAQCVVPSCLYCISVAVVPKRAVAWVWLPCARCQASRKSRETCPLPADTHTRQQRHFTPFLQAEGGMGHHGIPPFNISVSSTALDGTKVWGHLPAPFLNNWRLIFILLIVHHIDC